MWIRSLSDLGNVDFDRVNENDKNNKTVSGALFRHENFYPQKKVITFSKHFGQLWRFSSKGQFKRFVLKMFLIRTSSMKRWTNKMCQQECQRKGPVVLLNV